MRLLEKLRPLKMDMEKKGWVIESFRFKFKGTNYIVLVILYEQGEPRPQYALVQLDFLHPKNFNHHLLVPANTFRLLADAMDIRIFFRIQYRRADQLQGDGILQPGGGAERMHTLMLRSDDLLRCLLAGTIGKKHTT